MAHSGAPSVVQPQQTAQQKPKRPKDGDVKEFFDHEGQPSFVVKFKGDKVIIEKTGEADVLRTIVPKYGNIRKIDGQLKQAADDALWYLFNLTDSN